MGISLEEVITGIVFFETTSRQVTFRRGESRVFMRHIHPPP
jgi:hypothetical protein